MNEHKEVNSQESTSKQPHIALSSFIGYQDLGDKNFKFWPKPRKIEKLENGELVVELDNVPLPVGIPVPEGITFFYGFKDTLDQMESVYSAAQEKSYEVLKVELQINVFSHDTQKEKYGKERMERAKPGQTEEEVNASRIGLGTIHLDDIHLSRCLNIHRVDRYIRDFLILHPMNVLLANEAKNRGIKLKPIDNIAQAGARPDLLIEVVKSNPLLSHINSIIYTIPNGMPRGLRVCTVFGQHSFSPITVRGNAPFRIKMPKD